MITCTPAAIARHHFLMLIQALDETPEAKCFNMRLTINKCGTPACAFGHYICRSDLQSEFRLYKNTNPTQWEVIYIPTGQRIAYFDLPVLYHFGIDSKEHFDLFETEGCGGAKTAAFASLYVRNYMNKKFPQFPKRQPESRRVK